MEDWKMFSKLTRGFLVFLGMLLFITPSPMAQSASNVPAEPILDHAWRQYEYPPDYFAAEESTNPRIFQEVDILHYTIDATFILGDSYPDTGALEAVTTIDGQAKAETLTELIIDFYDNITINSFKLNDVEFSNYTRTDNKIWMDLSSDPLDPGEPFEITVDYERVYGSAYQGIMFRSHGESDTPAICSIDQPYRSPQWWPCFDYPG
jgi:aminopeptidase N